MPEARASARTADKVGIKPVFCPNQLNAKPKRVLPAALPGGDVAQGLDVVVIIRKGKVICSLIRK